MKQKSVYIEHNPYTLATAFKINGKQLAGNSKIAEKVQNKRLQEWIDDLPQLLLDELNAKEFSIEFRGTELDYEDVDNVFAKAEAAEQLTAKRKFTPGKSIADREAGIESVFRTLSSSQSPYPELRSPELLHAFEMVKNSDFEVCVVATMSAGKSTLINALLGTKLMPSKLEACTAIVTRIKDDPQLEPGRFRAEVYDKEGALLETNEALTYNDMVRLNGDERVSEICVYGRIPFLSEGESRGDDSNISLVLVDTPGPDYARDKRHEEVQRGFLNRSSKALVLYVLQPNFATNDDNNLLQRIARSMSVDGKASRDRFIFVANKLDDRKAEDGNLQDTLDSIREYLRSHKISDPQLYPAAALPALNIRLLDDPSVQLSVDDEDEVQLKIRKLNRNSDLHMEEHAVLPRSLQSEIERRLADASNGSETNAVDNPKTALIHTGLVSIEAQIRQYVRKYAKTAKLRNLVETFKHTLEELQCADRTKEALAKSEEERENLRRQIDAVLRKLDSGKEAQKFRDAMQSTVNEVDRRCEEEINEVGADFQGHISRAVHNTSINGVEYTLNEAETIARELERTGERAVNNLINSLEDIVESTLSATAQDLLDDYRRRIESLSDELGSVTGFRIEPLKLIGSQIAQVSMMDLMREKEVVVGQHYEKNKKKKWYKPWTWFQEKGRWVNDYETRRYVRGDELGQGYVAAAEVASRENVEGALEHARTEIAHLVQHFQMEFEKLDNVLAVQLNDFRALSEDEKRAAAEASKARDNLRWLDGIQNEVNALLEI